MSRPAGFTHSVETIEKIRMANIGKKCTPEMIEKMRKAKSGKKGPGSKVSDWAPMRGKKHSPETIAKMRAAAKGRKTPFVRWVEYDGKKFRSHWEVAFAKFMDARDIEWIYEPQKFDLGDTTYTPDFFVPEHDAFYEIKGWFSDISKDKVQRFRAMYPGFPLVVMTKPAMVLIGEKI